MGDGYLGLGRWRGIAVRVHWTTPIGAALLTMRPFSPAAWLAFVVVILVHEVGHAVVVRWCGGTVHAINVTGVGGTCWWSGRVSPLRRAAIAWGGVGAQLLLAVATIVALPYVGRPETSSSALVDVAYVLTVSNVLMALVNLVPIAPLDGAEAWRVVRLLRGPRPPLPATVVDDRLPVGRLDATVRDQLDRIFAASDDVSSPRERTETSTVPPGRRKR